MKSLEKIKQKTWYSPSAPESDGKSMLSRPLDCRLPELPFLVNCRENGRRFLPFDAWEAFRDPLL